MKRENLIIEANGHPALLEGYLLSAEFDGQSRGEAPAVLICPGGGYAFVSDREGEAVALRFNAAGFHAFVLHYTVAPEAFFPTALLQAARSLAMIRSRAEEWGIHPRRIVICGFSAGGHLAGSLSVLCHQPVVRGSLAVADDPSPDAQILCYPVITRGCFAHRASMSNLLGDGFTEEAAKQVSLEEHVCEETPPAFLWHTVSDDVVPVENSLLYASALRAAGVPFELHLYEQGCHGLSLCDSTTGIEAPDCAGWFDLAVQFVRRLP